MDFAGDDSARKSDVEAERRGASHIPAEINEVTGYKQELKRQLTLWDVATFMYNESGAWVSALNVLTIPFYNGGFSSAFWGIILLTPVILCYICCLSELISTYPTAGGQYHFVAILADKKYSRALSFICGYLSLFLWIASATSCFLSFAQQLFQIGAYFDPRVGDLSRWPQVAVAWGLLLFSFLASTFHVRLVTLLTQFQLYFTLAVFIVLNVLLLVKQDNKNDANLVFATVTVDSGWENVPWAWVIGSSYVFYCFSAMDCVSHLVEGIGINTLCTIIVILVLSFCTTDLVGAINAAPNFPLIAIVDTAVRNGGVAVFLCSVCFVTLIIAGPGCILISSRIIFSLARDNALPFHATFSKVDTRFQTPINASILASVIPAIITLIYVGNSTAFFAFTNTTSIFALLSFSMPIILVIIHGRDKIASRHFDLGKYGIICYYVSSIAGLFYCVVLCFPFYIPATSANMNYAPAVLGASLILVAMLWFLYAKNRFQGPIIELHGVESSCGAGSLGDDRAVVVTSHKLEN